MRDFAIALVNNPRKSAVGGYGLKEGDMNLGAQITAILGIQSYDEKVRSINFTRHAETGVSTLKLQLLRYSSGY